MPFISRHSAIFESVPSCVLVLGLVAAWSNLARAQDVPQPIETGPVETEQAAPEAPVPDDFGPAALEEVEEVEEEEIGTEPAPWDVSLPCENVQHPYQAELCQQWRTAEAAEEAAGVSRRNLSLLRLLMLTGLGALALLLLMFVPALMAAFAARRAARGAGSASSRLSAEEGREEELRAYVDVDHLEFVETAESEGVVKVRVSIRNSGQTPAFRLKGAIEVGVREVSDEDRLPVMTLPDRTALAPLRPRLGRDAVATEIVQCESPPKLANRVTGGDATILVWGLVEYFDVFEQRYRTTFQYLCNAETLSTGLVFKPMIRGDEDG